MTRWIVGCALVCAIGARADARCAMTELAPAPITQNNDALPADGGILVGFTSIVQGPKLDGDPSRQPGWTFVAGSKPIDLAIDTLAPGLTLYRPKPGTSPIVVSNADGKQLLAVARDGAASPPLKAPRPIRIATSFERGGRIARRQLVATLATPAPETAVAVILYAERDTTHVALSFNLLDRVERSTVVPYTDPRKCAWNPPGMASAKPGDLVTLAWVDGAGHVSPPSPPIQVERGADPE